MIYSEIYNFCKVKAHGGAHKNGTTEVPPRVQFILNLLDKHNIEYKVDKFENDRFPDNYFYNILLPGTNGKFITSHHDIINKDADNANDNSASVINAISTKLLDPSVNVILLDGEEPPMMGVGSDRAAKMINSGEYGKCDWVLNLELTGKGGDNFFIGNYPGTLFNHVKEVLNPPTFNTPFNDADIFRRNGIDSVVINPVPLTEKKTSIKNDRGYLDTTILWNCHTNKDSLDTISVEDMETFVNNVILKIIK